MIELDSILVAPGTAGDLSFPVPLQSARFRIVAKASADLQIGLAFDGEQLATSSVRDIERFRSSAPLLQLNERQVTVQYTNDTRAPIALTIMCEYHSAF